ncbi:RING-type domain-containing protein [Fusarium sp. LHS14.1]|nr:RING-type domain-containing protein [Fusarium sp. LHS14.1]
MCIRVDRWFYCQVQGQGLPAPPERDITNAQEYFWTHWQHGETVGVNEQQLMDLPPLQGYHYARHKEERWIRCAMTNITACMQYPLEIRTELYDIPCPECSQDDPCFLSAEPVRAYKNKSPNMTPDILAQIVDAYAYEIIILITSYFRMQINDMELDEPSWEVHQRGLYCTLDRDHIRKDTPIAVEGPVAYPCFDDCHCTVRPWAQNSSRAARNQAATQVRVRGMQQWFAWAKDEESPPLWVRHHFSNMPNQLWLNEHEDGIRRYTRLMMKVSTAARQLMQLGPGIQAGHSMEVRFTPSAYRRIIQYGQSTAMKLIAYPCLDPGITNEFLDLLMRDHFLSALCPFLDTTRDEVGWRRILDCHEPPSPAMEALLEQSELAFNHPRRNELNSHATSRHTALVNALERNRAICVNNALIKKQVAEGFAANWVVNSSYAASHTTTCHICTEDFDSVNADDDIPPHLRPVETRCCHQFMHFRCLKGSTLRREKCPLCNTGLKQMGFNEKIFVPGAQLVEEEHRGNLPQGMVENANLQERYLMDEIIDFILDWMEQRMRANEAVEM